MEAFAAEAFTLSVRASEPEVSASRAAAALPGGGVLYYALGGGLGHLMRAAAVARRFRRLSDEPFTVLTNCRLALPELSPRLQLADEGGNNPAGTGRLVQHLVAALRPRVLVTDAFPAGILGELAPFLPDLPCRRLAVLRRLQQRWIGRWNLPSVLEAYDAAALVEPGAGFDSLPPRLRRIETAPVLARDADELLSRPAAREQLRHRGEIPLICAAVTGTGPADQGLLQVVRRVGERLGGEGANGPAVQFAAPHAASRFASESIRHVPLLEWLPGIDLVVGPCGYHLCHETAATGTPAVFIPQRRLYDDQAGRAVGRRVARSPEELERHCRELLEAGPPERPRPAYMNGAGAVAELAAELCDR